MAPALRLSPLLACALLLAAADAGARWWWPFGDDEPKAPADERAIGEPQLYRWLDARGVVRYTPDLSRIPDTRRQTAIRVVPGTTPRGAPLGAAGGTGGTGATAGAVVPSASPAPAPPGGSSTVPTLAGMDPFNAPVEQRAVTSEAIHGNSWPELDARIAELEGMIAADEEVIKDLLTQPRAEGGDAVIHSPELREIAGRLPMLQGELNELRRWREQPRDR